VNEAYKMIWVGKHFFSYLLLGMMWK